jgi:hypothetical protein
MEPTMDPLLLILTLLAVGVLSAALLMPSERKRGHHWDDEDLRSQLGAGR